MRARPSSEALGLSLLYGAMFIVIGVQTPFWPVWLEGRGMSAIQIGFLLGAVYWAKVVTNPLIAQAVDTRGHRRKVMIAMAAVALVAFALYAVAQSFWSLLLLGILSGPLLAGLMPLTETVSMALTRQGRLDYGRVRLWGSLTFIAASLATGALVGRWGPPAILWMALAGTAATLACVTRLPDAAGTTPGGPRLPLRALFRNRPYRLLLVTASLLQASHCVYYGFATLHWRAQGLSDPVIGGLWAIGVVAEIGLFTFSAAIIRRLGPARLLLMGAFGGVIRWTALAFTVSPVALAPLQTLHAATFGAAHLSAMYLISGQVDGRLSARAQALYSSVGMGLAPGLALLAAGPTYAAWHGGAFLLPALLAATAVVGGWRLWRLTPPDSATPKDKAAESASTA